MAIVAIQHRLEDFVVVALCDILVVRVALRFALIIVAPHLVFVHAEAENKRGDLRSAVWQLLELGSHIEVRISAVISHDIEAIKVAVSPGFGHGVVVVASAEGQLLALDKVHARDSRVSRVVTLIMFRRVQILIHTKPEHTQANLGISNWVGVVKYTIHLFCRISFMTICVGNAGTGYTK